MTYLKEIESIFNKVSHQKSKDQGISQYIFQTLKDEIICIL